jgi:hypothetical protein
MIRQLGAADGFELGGCIMTQERDAAGFWQHFHEFLEDLPKEFHERVDERVRELQKHRLENGLEMELKIQIVMRPLNDNG